MNDGIIKTCHECGKVQKEDKPQCENCGSSRFQYKEQETKGKKEEILTQILYDLGRKYGFCSKEELQDFFREQIGDQSPAGYKLIGKKIAENFFFRGCAKMETSNPLEAMKIAKAEWRRLTRTKEVTKMSKEKEEEFRTKFGLTENGFIILDLPKVQIPEELLKNGRDFVYPLDGFTGSSNMPKPPMQSSAGNYIKINTGNIYVSEKGEICIHPYRFDEFCERSSGVENAIKTIRKDIENLPKLFQWALEIRKEQDRMFAQICAMLPGWKIRGLEGMKYNRHEEYLRNNFWKHGKYSHGEIRSWVEFLKNNGVDLTPPEEEISC